MPATITALTTDPASVPSRDVGQNQFPVILSSDATWEQRPPRPVSSGATVIGESDRLAERAASLLR